MDRPTKSAMFAGGSLLLVLFLLFMLTSDSRDAEGPTAPGPASPPAAPVPAPLPPADAPPAPVPPIGPEAPPAEPAAATFVLRGTVRRPDGGPAAGAMVVLVREGEERASALLVTDVTGAFTWRSTDAEISLRVWAILRDAGVASTQVHGKSGEETAVDLALESPREQPIHVLDARGLPCRFALVEAAGGTHPVARLLGRIARGRTDMEGLASLPVPAGLPLEFRAKRRLDPEEAVVAVEAAPGPAAPVEIRFPSRVPGGIGEVRAVVTGADGEPLVGVTVRGHEWEPAGRGGAIGRYATTDEFGAMVFLEAPDGPWDVRLSPRKAGDWIEKRRTNAHPGEDHRIEAVPCGALEVLPVPAETPGSSTPVQEASLWPAAFLPEGAKVEDLERTTETVSLHEPTTEDPWPGFRALLPPGRWTFLLMAPDRVARLLPPATVASGAVLQLDPVPMERGARLTGRIEAPPGVPRPRAVFLPRNPDGEARPGERVMITVGGDGIFATGTVIPPGRGWLHVSAEECAPTVIAVEDLQAGVVTDVGTLKVTRGGSVVIRPASTGSLLLYAGKDDIPTLGEIPSRPWIFPPFWLLQRMPDAEEGTLYLHHVAPGRWFAVTPGGGAHGYEFEVREGETTLVTR